MPRLLLLLQPRSRCPFSMPLHIEPPPSLAQLPSRCLHPPSSSSPLLLDPLNLPVLRSSSPAAASSVHDGASSWRKRLEDLLWTASAAFIVYYGDFHTNLLAILAFDLRISRISFNLGLLCLLLIFAIFLYLCVRCQTSAKRAEEAAAPGAVPALTFIGFAAYILFSHALWPIWNLLTLPMLFTLFMAIVVVVPYLVPHSFYSCTPNTLITLRY